MLKNKKTKNSGFTLIEVAIVMVIMGSLLSGLLAALTRTTESTRRNTAEAQLARIEEALYGFAQANGRLPCPATEASNGLEDFANQATGICTREHGLVPNATLSLHGQINGDGLLNDPWSNPYRYSVSTLSISGNRTFTSSTGLTALFNSPASLVEGPDLIRVCSDNQCNADDQLSNIVPAVIFSMGENWATTNTACGAVPLENADEDENAGADSLVGTENNYCVTNTMDFVSRTYVQDVFDDVVIWLSPHILFSRLISAGQLP